MSLKHDTSSSSPATDRNNLLNDEEEVLSKYGRCGVNNLCVLYVTAFLFGGFCVAELIGALAGNSLSLLGDAAAMSVDVFTYFSNMYAEWIKNKHGFLDGRTRFILEVYIPSFSVLALLAVTAYILSDAINVIRNKGHDDGSEVSVVFLFAFSTGNFLVDVFSSLMFYLRGADGFKNYAQVKILEEDAMTTDSERAPLRHYSLDERTERLIVGSEDVLNNYYGTQTLTNANTNDTNHTDKNATLNSNAKDEKAKEDKAPPVPASLAQDLSQTVRKIRHNLNMLSAFTHVGSDTLRTLSVFVAAMIATFTGVSGNLCDAWAAVVVSLTICGAVMPLCSEIYKAATHPLDDHGREIVKIKKQKTNNNINNVENINHATISVMHSETNNKNDDAV